MPDISPPNAKVPRLYPKMTTLFSSFLPSKPLLILSSSNPTTTTKRTPPQRITSTIQESKPNSPSLPSNNNNNIPIKIPSPPWMTSPLALSPDQLLNLSHPNSKPNKKTHQKTQHNAYKSLTGGVRGGRSRQAMKQIVGSIKKLREIDCEVEEVDIMRETRKLNELSANVPWVRVEERMVFRREKKERVVTKAEKELSREELERLRDEGKRLKCWVKAPFGCKVKKTGVNF